MGPPGGCGAARQRRCQPWSKSQSSKGPCLARQAALADSKRAQPHATPAVGARTPAGARHTACMAQCRRRKWQRAGSGRFRRARLVRVALHLHKCGAWPGMQRQGRLALSRASRQGRGSRQGRAATCGQKRPARGGVSKRNARPAALRDTDKPARRKAIRAPCIRMQRPAGGQMPDIRPGVAPRHGAPKECAQRWWDQGCDARARAS